MNGISEAQFKHAIKVLQKGGTIVYPTDTVYGLGADATNVDAVAKVRTIKGRDANKPILAMVADIKMLEQYAVVTPLAYELVKKFLPGPLAIVLEAKSNTLVSMCSADGSLGFRIPKNEFCLELTQEFGKPITSTSVNHSGMEQSRTLEKMLVQLGEGSKDVDYVVDVGELAQNHPSTIVDARGDKAHVLREGAVSLAALNRFL